MNFKFLVILMITISSMLLQQTESSSSTESYLPKRFNRLANKTRKPANQPQKEKLLIKRMFICFNCKYISSIRHQY